MKEGKIEELIIKTATQENDIQYFKTFMQKNDEDHKIIFKKIDQLAEKISELPQSLENKFASKWTERGFIFLGTIGGGAIIIKFMSLIFI